MSIEPYHVFMYGVNVEFQIIPGTSDIRFKADAEEHQAEHKSGLQSQVETR
ncbi:MAG: hypothetical protein KME64_33790 [Scytonematopsis contorta HA4267-MV1]|jgi:hypothetical protein|nr:hypothetical protein [Scytonematopsis contorta HA4267-MV1]